MVVRFNCFLNPNFGLGFLLKTATCTNNKSRYMKAAVIFFGILSFCAESSFAQADKKHLAGLSLKGVVKEMTIRSYVALDNFGKAIKGERANENVDYLFNGSGNQVEQNVYNQNGSLRARYTYRYSDDKLMEQNVFNPGGAMKSKLKYKYNSIGLLAEESMLKPDGQLVSKYAYEYNSHSKMIASSSWDAGGAVDSKSTYLYDTRGSLVDWYSVNAGGEFIIRVISTYDAGGNITGEDIYASKDSLEKKSIFTYGENGKLVEQTVFNADGSFRKFTYRYDVQGNVSEENQLDKDGNVIEQYTSKFEYDRRMNWIKKTMWRNGVPVLITEREIVYFKK
jgi:hypothetical protein